MTPTEPRDLLKAYSEKSVTNDQVMRGLAGHQGFYVPALFALDHLPQKVSDHTIVFGTPFEAKPGQLVLFTDAVAAHRAEGYPIGPFNSAYTGSEIFQAVDERYEAISINPCSPQEESWFIKRDGFGLAKLWGQVVELEKSMAEEPGSDAMYRRLASHPGFMILLNQEGRPIDITVPGVEGRSAVAFTAPDLCEGFLSGRSEEQRARLKPIAISGGPMFTQLQNFDLAAVLLNFGPNARTVTKAEFPQICALARAV